MQITIDLPEALVRLPQPERESLLRAGLHEAIRARIHELETEVQQAQMHVAQFEQRYGVPFAQFERDLLPTFDAWQAHEAYNDWFFWQSVLAEKEQILRELRHS